MCIRDSVDILNGALQDMGGWPICETIRCWCCSVSGPVRNTPPQMVEAFKKVCQQVNEAKLFNMGLQCRAGMYKIERKAGEGVAEVNEFCVLVEKEMTKSFAMWKHWTHWNIFVL